MSAGIGKLVKMLPRKFKWLCLYVNRHVSESETCVKNRLIKIFLEKLLEMFKQIRVENSKVGTKECRK